MASACGTTPVMFPGNKIIGILTAFFKFPTTSAISIWSVAEEPPTSIDPAPRFSASFAYFIDDLMLEASESIKTKTTGPFLRLFFSRFSTLPLIPLDRYGIFKVLF